MRILSNLLLLAGALVIGAAASFNLYDVMLLEDPVAHILRDPWWVAAWPAYAFAALALVSGGVMAVGARRS
ncbi:MAG: hypothetical protein AAGH41_02200 [Pseudomonadota bacterium]